MSNVKDYVIHRDDAFVGLQLKSRLEILTVSIVDYLLSRRYALPRPYSATINDQNEDVWPLHEALRHSYDWDLNCMRTLRARERIYYVYDIYWIYV